MFDPGSTTYSSDASTDSALTRALQRREHHRRRPRLVRVLTAGAGALVSVVGLALFFAPELALPLLVAGLGLLALEFNWAARALGWVLVRASRLKGWFGRRPRPLRMARAAFAKRQLRLRTDWPGRHGRVFVAFFAGVALATILSPLLARADAETPGTPAAGQLGWVLAQLNAARTPSAPEISAHFTTSFLRAVPPASLVAALSPISAERPVRIVGIVGKAEPLHLVARLETARGSSLRATIVVSAQAPNRIESLLMEPFTRPAPIASWTAADRALARLGAQAGLFAAQVRGGQLGRVVHARRAAVPVAIGSAFKLYVLGALAQAVSDRRASWDEQLPIHQSWKSLPSGTLQNEPSGMRFTLRHYAEQMISISDNTAADHLIHRLGRAAVERELVALGNVSSARDLPFLTTREMFALKISAPHALRVAFATAKTQERRQLLAHVDALPVRLAQAAGWTGPRSIGTIEWFASPRDLGRAMIGLQTLARTPGLHAVGSILALNPGIRFDPRTWRYIAYKGGSEPGVLSLTWYLERADGAAFVLSIAVNDARHPIDESATLAVAEGAATLLAHA